MNKKEFGSKYVHQMSNERLLTYLIITGYSYKKVKDSNNYIMNEPLHGVVTPIPIRLRYFV